MRNITVSIPDEVYRQARIRAAEQGTSLSALVRELLIELSADQDGEFARLAARQEELVRSLAGTGFRAADNLSRADLHDRGLR